MKKEWDLGVSAAFFTSGPQPFHESNPKPEMVGDPQTKIFFYSDQCVGVCL